MAKITYIQPDGSSQVVEAKTGVTVMEAAKLNDIPGIEAECGGACACATCHVYVDEDWRDKTGKPSEMEEDMLDFAFDVREASRSVSSPDGCAIEETGWSLRPLKPSSNARSSKATASSPYHGWIRAKASRRSG